MTDLQRAFEPDAPRELVEDVNRMCAEAEGIGILIHRIQQVGKYGGEKYEYYRPNPLANYVGDMNNLMRFREKAIEKDSRMFTSAMCKILDIVAHIEDGDEETMACAPPWAILKAAYEVLKGDKNGK